MFQIESGVPLPPRHSGRGGRPIKYGFDRMQVGDSIFVPEQGSDGGACVSARDYAKRHGLRFSTQQENGGVRIWRAE